MLTDINSYFLYNLSDNLNFHESFKFTMEEYWLTNALNPFIIAGNYNNIHTCDIHIFNIEFNKYFSFKNPFPPPLKKKYFPVYLQKFY